MISRTKKKLIFFSIVAATLTYNCIKTFNSFKDIYILDLQETVQRIKSQPEQKGIYINPKEFQRLSGNSEECYIIPEKSEDINNFYIKYLFSPRKMYLVQKGRCKSMFESDNCLKINTDQKIILEKALFLTNSDHNHYISVNELEKVDNPMEVKNEIARAPGGMLNISKDMVNVKNAMIEASDQLVISGKRSIMQSRYNIIALDNSINSEVIVKNIGNNPTVIYIGYAVYSNECIWLDGRNYPYKSNLNSLNIQSIDASGNSIVVDSFNEWDKNCFLAINVQDDFSDIPNSTFAGKISDVKELPDGFKKIILEEPINNTLLKNNKVRIHGRTGAYLYTSIHTLAPNKSKKMTATIKKDDSNIAYSNKSFPRGTCYVKPILLSYSVDPDIENTVLVETYRLVF